MTTAAVKVPVRERQVPVGIRRKRLLLRVANHAVLVAVSLAFLSRSSSCSARR